MEIEGKLAESRQGFRKIGRIREKVGGRGRFSENERGMAGKLRENRNYFYKHAGKQKKRTWDK